MSNQTITSLQGKGDSFGHRVFFELWVRFARAALCIKPAGLNSINLQVLNQMENRYMTHSRIIASTRQWVETVVVGLKLCPFASRELQKARVRFAVTDAETEAELLMALSSELSLLSNTSTIETTLLIHHRALLNFYAFNDFLQIADDLLVALELEDILQIASFHPNYQFSDTAPDDVQNYTNRSPSPMLHLIREESLAQAIAEYPHVERIPSRNVALMQSMGGVKMQALLQGCIENISTHS